MSEIQRLFVPVLAVGLIGAATWQANAAPATISLYGATLGQKLALPDCDSISRGKVMCAKSVMGSIADLLPGATRTVLVTFANDGRPDIVQGSVFTVKTKEGLVQEIIVSTGGIKVQETALKQLIQKFGQPKSLENKVLQNGFGAKFTVVEAGWNGPGWFISFAGAFDDDLSTGTIVADTDQGMLERLDELRKRKSAQPRL